MLHYLYVSFNIFTMPMSVKEGVYCRYTGGIPFGNPGKVRLGKVSIVQNRVGELNIVKCLQCGDTLETQVRIV